MKKTKLGQALIDGLKSAERRTLIYTLEVQPKGCKLPVSRRKFVDISDYEKVLDLLRRIVDNHHKASMRSIGSGKLIEEAESLIGCYDE